MKRVSGVRYIATLSIVILTSAIVSVAEASPRLDLIREKGRLTCGVLPRVVGFSAVDNNGKFSGFEIDICRALSAAIFGTPDKVAFVIAETVEQFERDDDIDVVARRLTWTFKREVANRLLFSPIIFFDGAGFLVSAESSVHTPLQMSGQPVCVHKGSETEESLEKYFRANKLELIAVSMPSIAAAADAFFAGRCVALSGDVSELGALRSTRASSPKDFAILPDMVSKEPLALLMRQGDDQFFLIVRWTIYALIESEELGITSSNLDAQLGDANPAIKAFLEQDVETSRVLGLDENWIANVIKAVGNYGEVFERHFGAASPTKLERGLNRLWTSGGLMYAPPVR